MDGHTADLPPFSAFLMEHRKGALNAEVTAVLADVVRRVAETGKAGKVSITLEIAPMKKGQTDGLLVVTDQVQGRPPQEDREGGLWFATPGGGLSRRDPRQASFDEMMSEGEHD